MERKKIYDTDNKPHRITMNRTHTHTKCIIWTLIGIQIEIHKLQMHFNRDVIVCPLVPILWMNGECSKSMYSFGMREGHSIDILESSWKPQNVIFQMNMEMTRLRELISNADFWTILRSIDLIFVLFPILFLFPLDLTFPGLNWCI